MPTAVQDRTNLLLRRPARPHPYAGVRHDSQGRYYDFKERTDLIGTVLEDFVPHAANPGVQRFYALLKFVNGGAGPFETTDCGLSQGLHRSRNSPFPDKAGWVGGRVMVMWRQVDRNCQWRSVKTLLKRLRRELRRAGKPYQYTGFVVGPFPTYFREVKRQGHQIDIEFAMWGDSFDEAMERFADVVEVLERALKACGAKP